PNEQFRVSVAFEGRLSSSTPDGTLFVLQVQGSGQTGGPLSRALVDAPPQRQSGLHLYLRSQFLSRAFRRRNPRKNDFLLRLGATRTKDARLSGRGGIRLGGGGLDAAPGFATGLLPSSLSEAVTLTFRGNIGNRVGIEGGGMGARTRSGDSSPELKSLAGHLRLDFKLTERLIAFSTVG